jgi:hypothetical protein
MRNSVSAASFAGAVFCGAEVVFRGIMARQTDYKTS